MKRRDLLLISALLGAQLSITGCSTKDIFSFNKNSTSNGAKQTYEKNNISKKYLVIVSENGTVVYDVLKSADNKYYLCDYIIESNNSYSGYNNYLVIHGNENYYEFSDLTDALEFAYAVTNDNDKVTYISKKVSQNSINEKKLKLSK